MATQPLTDQIAQPSYIDESKYERIDGQLVARPVPGDPHSTVQGNVYVLLREQGKSLGFKTNVEWSLARPAETIPEASRRFGDDYLTPDILVATQPYAVAENGHLIPPGFLAVEVRSPQQTGLFNKAELLWSWGVEHVWIIDPASQECFEYHGGDQFTKVSTELRAGPLSVPLNSVFEEQ